MLEVLHLGFVLFAFFKSSSLRRTAVRLQDTEPGEPAAAALQTATGCAVLATLILLCLSAYYQQHWHKMKSWTEIRKVQEEAAARGVQLTEDEVELEARKKVLAEQGRARLAGYGAVGASVLLMLASFAIRLFELSEKRALKVFASASLGVIGIGVAVFFLLQRPWDAERRSLEADDVARMVWANDPPRSPEYLQEAVQWREYKEKKGTPAFLLAALGVAASAVGGGWLLVRLRRTGRAVRWVRRLMWAVFAASLAGLISMVFRVPQPSGISTTSSNQQGYFHLRDIVRAETEHRERDLDGNKIHDWWVADVSSLSRLMSGEFPIGRLSGDFFHMDGSALPNGKGRIELETIPAKSDNMIYPRLVQVIPEGPDGTPYAEDLDGDGNAFESTRGFAFCSYPAKYGERGALETLIVDQTGVMWRKDIGGAAVKRWPADPEKEGWKKWIEGARRRQVYTLTSEEDE
jgi:hypothetical protein